jgi:hypothetical protein
MIEQMTYSEIDFRAEAIKLLRSHQEQLTDYDIEASERRKRLAYRHFRSLELLDDDAGFVMKALMIRKHYLQMQRYKVRLQKKRDELLSKQARELKEMKSRWAKAKLHG